MFTSAEKLLSLFLQYPQVCTDTRKVQENDLYFALKGDNFDGNEYAAQALAKGAAFVVVDNPVFFVENNPHYLLVNNTLAALQTLARDYRRTFDIPFLGITGSNGKTTSKELIASVLRTEKQIYATQGNLNNHIGVPLTLLSVPKTSEIAVIEMGANQPDDIKELCEIAEPTEGLITNIGKAHLEKLINLKGVQTVKGQLFEGVALKDGTIFVNETDPLVVEIKGKVKKNITFGTKESDFGMTILHHSAEGMKIEITCKHWQKSETFDTQLSGAYNALNVLAAVAIGDYFGISIAGIKKGIYDYVPTNHRSQWVEKGGLRIFIDAYNANPSSMKAAITNIFEENPNKKIGLILGDMFELGAESAQEHESLGKHVAQYSPACMALFGKEMAFAYKELQQFACFHALKVADSKENVLHLLQDANVEVLLIKGSRGMALEKVLDWFE